MMQTLLLAEVSEKTTDIVTIISVAALALLVIVFAVLLFSGKKTYDTRSIVYGGVCLAASFALSFLKFEFPYGGSITLMSFIPVLLYAYVYGPVRGLIVGFVYGILQFIQSPWILTPMSFILDFLLAFSCIAFMGFAKKFTKNATANVLIGTGLVFFTRLIMHLFAGIIYFKHGVVAEGLPTSSAFVYSLCYNIIYLAIDCALCMIGFYLISRKNGLAALENMMKAPRRAAPAGGPEGSDGADGAENK